MNCRNQTFQTQYCNADLRHSLQQRSIEQKIRRLCIPLEKNPAVFAGSCFLPAFSRPQVYPALRGPGVAQGIIDIDEIAADTIIALADKLILTVRPQNKQPEQVTINHLSFSGIPQGHALLHRLLNFVGRDQQIPLSPKNSSMDSSSSYTEKS